MYTSSGVKGASFTANTVLIDGVWQTKKRFAKEWAEAEKATQQAEKTEHDLNATKLDVEKVKTARFRLRVGRVLGSLLHLLNFVYLSPSFLSLRLIFLLKAKHHAHVRTHTAEESRNDYASQLQKYNKEQNYFYYTEIPQIFNVRYLSAIARRDDAGGWNLRSRLDVCAIRKCRRWKSRGFGTW